MRILSLGLGVRTSFPPRTFSEDTPRRPPSLFPPSLATENTGSVNLERQQIQGSDEVIDRNILVGLAILAQANGHSVVQEMNIALSGYVENNLPQVLDEDVTDFGKPYSYAQS